MFKHRQLAFRTLAILLLILTGIVFIVASGGGGDDDGSGGRTFSLPAGIQVQSIIGDEWFGGDRCINRSNGTKYARFIYITLVNTTSVAIEVTIPAGLIFEPASTPPPDRYPAGIQHMMVVQDNTFIVRTGAHSFCIWVICAGGGGTPPNDEFRYGFGLFVEDECQWELINLLRGRHLSAMSNREVRHLFSMAGLCVSRGGLSDEDREFLRSLP